MALYLVKLEQPSNPFHPDHYEAFVIRANSKDEARMIAATEVKQHSTLTNFNEFMDPTKTSVTVLIPTGPDSIILST